LQSVEPMRAEAERLRAVIEGNRQRRKSVWRQYLAKTLAAVGLLFAVLAAIISLEPLTNSVPSDPLMSLEALSKYLRR
jgi:hypothetical protein